VLGTVEGKSRVRDEFEDCRCKRTWPVFKVLSNVNLVVVSETTKISSVVTGNPIRNITSMKKALSV
jgi:hypothetical protein